MKVQIVISPKQALAIGRDVAGTHNIGIDPAALTETQRQTLAECGKSVPPTRDGDWKYEGEWKADLYLPADPYQHGAGEVTDTTTEALLAWLDKAGAVLAKRAFDLRETEKANAKYKADRQSQLQGIVRQLMQLNDEQLRKANITSVYVIPPGSEDYQGYDLSGLDDCEERRWLEETRQRITALDKAAAAIQDKKRKEREQAKEEAKLTYLNTWMLDHASHDDREQWKDGLLSRNDAIALLADSVLDPIGPSLVSEKEMDELGNSCRCNWGEVAAISRKAYAAWLELQNLLPKGAKHEFLWAELYEHETDAEGVCCLNGDGLPRGVYAVRVKIAAGPFTLERMILLSEEEPSRK